MEEEKTLSTHFIAKYKKRGYLNISEEEFDKLLHKSENCEIIEIYNFNLSDFIFDSITFKNVEFYNCIFDCADFINCNIENCTFNECNMKSIDFHNTLITNTKFTDVNLSKSKFEQDTVISNVKFRETNLSKVDFKNANISNIYGNVHTQFYHLQCPEEGSFIGFKKVETINSTENKYYILKLFIPEDAKRSSATSRKCRASYVKTLKIEEYDKNGNFIKEVNEVENRMYLEKTLYKVNEFTYPSDFDENRWDECSEGIHFFITKEEAIQYKI